MGHVQELCFVRSPVIGESHIVDSVKFSTLIKKLSQTLPKNLLNHCIKIYECACRHGFLYPEINISGKVLTYSWTNNTKFLNLAVSNRDLEYTYGDHRFSTRQIGSLDQSDYDHRLLEISLFYSDEEIRPYVVKK